jgi:hypothetical protein
LKNQTVNCKIFKIKGFKGSSGRGFRENDQRPVINNRGTVPLECWNHSLLFGGESEWVVLKSGGRKR